jgi:hypothetical protein
MRHLSRRGQRGWLPRFMRRVPHAAGKAPQRVNKTANICIPDAKAAYMSLAPYQEGCITP